MHISKVSVRKSLPSRFYCGARKIRNFTPFTICVYVDDVSLVTTLGSLTAEISESSAQSSFQNNTGRAQPILPRGKLVKSILEATITF